LKGKILEPDIFPYILERHPKMLQLKPGRKTLTSSLGDIENNSQFLGKQLPNEINIGWTACAPSVYVRGVVFPIPSGKWELGRKLAQAKK
jgi:hypothetical protein